MYSLSRNLIYRAAARTYKYSRDNSAQHTNDTVLPKRKHTMSSNTGDVLRDIRLDELHQVIKGLQEKAATHVDRTLDELVRSVMDEITDATEKRNGKVTSLLLGDENDNPTKREQERGSEKKAHQKAPTDKQFAVRNSLLTDLFEIKHIHSIYHMFLAVLMLFITNTCIGDLLEHGRVRLGLEFIAAGFGRMHVVGAVWLTMFGTALAVHVLFSGWASIRARLKRASGSAHDAARLVWWWDRVGVAALIFHHVTALCLPAALVLHELPIASKAVVLGEQIRLIMKVHAFVRSSVPRVMAETDRNKKKDDDGDGKRRTTSNGGVPPMSRYLYFLFAPTLVYRDSYPRCRGGVRWWFAAARACEVVGCLFLVSFVVENHLVARFREFGARPETAPGLAATMFACVLPGSMLLLCLFYLLLHAWLNCWAEVLGFADRMFYRDWWNATSFSQFYRTWNVVVHDFLYAYVYKDMYETVAPGARATAITTVFLVSALVHEYILICLFGFCYPVMFVQFAGFGLALAFLRVPQRSSLGNVLLWWSLAVGLGLQSSLYAMEYFARLNCPHHAHPNAFLDLLVPRSWTCNGLGVKQ